jgi:hypothetical protein
LLISTRSPRLRSSRTANASSFALHRAPQPALASAQPAWRYHQLCAQPSRLIKSSSENVVPRRRLGANCRCPSNASQNQRVKQGCGGRTDPLLRNCRLSRDALALWPVISSPNPTLRAKSSSCRGVEAAHEKAMARERCSRAMWRVRFCGLQGRAKPDIPVTVPVVVERAGGSRDACEDRQGENRGKDGFHDHLLWDLSCCWCGDHVASPHVARPGLPRKAKSRTRDEG